VNNHEFDIYVELYKREEYSLIPIGSYPNGDYFYMTTKQIRALELLNDDNTTHVGYGGSARSGKSIIECTAIIFDCNAYPDIAWGLARKELTTLKRTVLITMFNQLSFYGFSVSVGVMKNKYEFNYNQQLNKISFYNKSDVFLIDSMFKPSDPLNTRFGGFELTRSAIDESNETNITVVNKLFERTGWRNNDTYNLKRKQFECFNPDKNHVYSRFYIPFRDKIEPDYKKFIPALPSDNPNPSVKEWVHDIIRTGDTATIERQIHGNFDYDDDPSKLCDYDAICDMFTNDHVKEGTKIISADLAMQGRDKFIAGSWSGLICTVALDKAKCTAKEIELDLKELKTKDEVGNSNIVADSDGLGAYLESYIENIKTFHGGSTKVTNKDEFKYIKDECGFKLAELINNRKIKIICSQAQAEEIKKEISVCLKKDNDTLGKKKLIKKDKMKELLGHSPDYMDMLLMRMVFELNKEGLVFSETSIKTYKEVPTEIVNKIEVKKGFQFAFIATPDDGSDIFTMPIFRIVDNYVYLEDVIFNQDELITQEIDVAEKIKQYDIKKTIAETNKAMASFKTRLQEKNTSTEVYGQWSKPNKIQKILSFSGIIKKYFLFPENPNEETDQFMQQVYQLVKTSTDEDEAASSLAGSAAHLEEHYGLFK
jgi:hypothetical protein